MITELTLGQFKKHKYLNKKIESKLLLIHGDNAAGKTSLLEAVSLFSPGAGLFNNEIETLPTIGCETFEINIQAFCTASLTYSNQKKEIKINEMHKRPLEALEYFRIYGITPYIALAFWKDSTVRRRHIDRLVMQNDPTYASAYAQYSKTLKERNKLIENNQFNSAWANIMNPILAQTGMQITKTRNYVLQKICAHLPEEIKQFLGSDMIISMSPSLEEQEKIFAKGLDHNFIGPHRTKFEIRTKEYDGATASTGQQKKLLLSLTIAALPDNELTSVLLLDDLFANLDKHAIIELLNVLHTRPFQSWMTNIDAIEHDALQLIGL